MIRIIVLLAVSALLNCHLACVAQESSQNKPVTRQSQILGVLKIEFQKRNPVISHIEVFDVRSLFLSPIIHPDRPNHYLVVAKGVRSDLRFQGSFEDELLGLFVLDDSLFAVKRTVALIPSQHWGDFFLRIEKVWNDSVLVRGVDLRGGDTNFLKKFSLLD